MTEVEQQQQQPPPSQNGLDLSGGEDDDKGSKSRPADIEQVTKYSTTKSNTYKIIIFVITMIVIVVLYI